MTKQAFIEELAGVLQLDSATTTVDTRLDSGGVWDSLTQLSVIAFVMDSLGQPPDPQRLADCSTVGDIVVLLDGRLE